MKQLKVLQITKSLANGGAEKFLVELSNNLSINNTIVICTIEPNEPWMIPPMQIKNSTQVVLKKYHKLNPLNIWQFVKLFRQQKPNVVHVHALLLFNYVFIASLFFKNIKFVHTIHNDITPAYKKVYKKIAALHIFAKYWLHVCISKEINQNFKENFSVLNFTTIDNGIIPLAGNRQIKNNNKLNLLCIGNYSDFKRFDLAAEVADKLNNNGIKTELTIVGEDRTPGRVNWQKISSKNYAHVYQVGSKSNVSEFLCICDALLLTSSMEGMPLIILEAMSLGVPIISTPVGGIPSLVQDGINGTLSESIQLEAIYDAVCRFNSFNDEQKEHIAKNNVSKFNEKFHMRICAHNYLQLFNQ